jgi:hypothetical protein
MISKRKREQAIQKMPYLEAAFGVDDHKILVKAAVNSP